MFSFPKVCEHKLFIPGLTASFAFTSLLVFSLVMPMINETNAVVMDVKEQVDQNNMPEFK